MMPEADRGVTLLPRSMRPGGDAKAARPKRIALVNPSVGYSDRRKSKPIGLAYVGTYLRSRGHEVVGFDFGDSPTSPRELSTEHALDAFAVVGFSVYNESLAPTIEHARWIKERNPAALIVLGGPHATAVHEEIITRYDCVDAVVRREGELPMAALAEATGPLSDAAIPGTTVRRSDGRVIVNPDAPFVDDLDSLPFPDMAFISDSGYGELTYFDGDAGEVVPAIAINSSRSCPYNCAFCGVLTIGRKYRARSGTSVVAEIAHFREQDGQRYRHVYFSDANFFVYPKHAMEIVEALHVYDPAITFSFGTRVNQLLRHRQVIPDMKKMGLRFVELGVESASESVLKRLAKGVHPQQNWDAVRMLDQLGIEISLDFIMVDPETTLDDLEDNRRFLQTTGLYDYVPHDHLYTSLSLYAGTPIRDYYAEKLGLVWDIEELPVVDSLLVDPYVAWVRTGLLWFRSSYQDAIDSVLAECEAELQARVRHRESHPPTAEELRLQLLVVALRHAPSRYFERLLAVARGAQALAKLPEEEFDDLVPVADIGGVLRLSDALAEARQLLPRVDAGNRSKLGEEELV
jgi:radical SAM superfamily enzyme YgiQ (UPF0313 family)